MKLFEYSFSKKQVLTSEQEDNCNRYKLQIFNKNEINYCLSMQFDKINISKINLSLNEIQKIKLVNLNVILKVNEKIERMYQNINDCILEINTKDKILHIYSTNDLFFSLEKNSNEFHYLNFKSSLGNVISNYIIHSYVRVPEPNIIVLNTGQSNSQGYNSSCENNYIDMKYDNICFLDVVSGNSFSNDFGWNEKKHMYHDHLIFYEWYIADLNDKIGTHNSTNNLAVFHFAKKYIENNPNKTIGILNYGIGGQSISRWVYWTENQMFGWNNHLSPEYSIKIAKNTIDNYNIVHNTNISQGDIFFQIAKIIYTLGIQNKIKIVLWHQGEEDGSINNSSEFYFQQLEKLIKQLKEINSEIVFIAGTTTGTHDYTDIGWEKVNPVIRNLDKDGDIYTNYCNFSDLETNHEINDLVHFSTKSVRLMGYLYYKKYEEIMEYVKYYTY